MPSDQRTMARRLPPEVPSERFSKRMTSLTVGAGAPLCGLCMTTAYVAAHPKPAGPAPRPPRLPSTRWACSIIAGDDDLDELSDRLVQRRVRSDWVGRGGATSSVTLRRSSGATLRGLGVVPRGQQDYAWYAGFVPASATTKPIVVVVTVQQGGFGARPPPPSPARSSPNGSLGGPVPGSLASQERSRSSTSRTHKGIAAQALSE